jgi:O-antigen/teichoic acid export membrane protein
MHIGKAIAGNVLAGSLGRIINALTPLLLVPFMIRSWGLHVYGEWLILTAIPTYMMLSPDFGLAGAVVNQMAISTMEGKRRDAICMYRTSWLFLTVMALCFVLLGIVVAAWVRWKPLGVSMLSNHAAWIISWSCIQIFIGQQIFLLGGIYRSARRNPRAGLLGSLGGGFCLVACGVALVLGSGPATYVVVTAAAKAALLGAMQLDVHRIMPDFTLGLKGVSIQAVRPYIIPGLGHATMPLIYALQNEGMVLVLGAILGPVSVAVFQTTRTAVNGAKSLSGLVSMAIGIELPALVGEGRMSAVRRLLVINTQAALAATCCWLALLGLFGRPIFHLWLRNGAIFSTSLVLIMLGSMFPFAIANSFSIILLATNQIHRAVLLLLVAGVMSLGITAAGSVLLGLNGAAYGLVVYETLAMVIMCCVAAKHTRVPVWGTLSAICSMESIKETYRTVFATSQDAFRLVRESLL